VEPARERERKRERERERGGGGRERVVPSRAARSRSKSTAAVLASVPNISSPAWLVYNAVVIRRARKRRASRRWLLQSAREITARSEQGLHAEVRSRLDRDELEQCNAAESARQSAPKHARAVTERRGTLPEIGRCSALSDISREMFGIPRPFRRLATSIGSARFACSRNWPRTSAARGRAQSRASPLEFQALVTRRHFEKPRSFIVYDRFFQREALATWNAALLPLY
jgi:hypothetical protein